MIDDLFPGVKDRMIRPGSMIKYRVIHTNKFESPLRIYSGYILIHFSIKWNKTCNGLLKTT